MVQSLECFKTVHAVTAKVFIEKFSTSTSLIFMIQEWMEGSLSTQIVAMSCMKIV